MEGEISNLSQPSSGHWYFTLKDEQAQVRCAMFRGRNAAVSFTPKSGDLIKVRAQVSLYEGRGDYQLIVEHMETAGFGILQKRLEELKKKLGDEGLFDPAWKKSIPMYPRHIAIVSSASGAAVHDVLTVLKRRAPHIGITIVPSLVQGEEAPHALINALHKADNLNNCDAILLCRGGGTIEDLWAFNSEELARTIFSLHTPVVCGVGHEVDTTLADYIADVRAATPSAAAELLSPDREETYDKHRATCRAPYIVNQPWYF